MSTFKNTIADSANVNNINATGNITGKKCGIFAALSAQADTTITTAGTYYPVLGTFTNAPIECFGVATTYTPGIKYSDSLTQYFEIDWHASLSCDSKNATVHCSIFKNGVLVSSSVMSTFLKNLGQQYNLSGTTVVELATDDEIQLMATANDDGDKITFYSYTTTISEFFD